MKVGIVGASGYVGGELLRILLLHEKVDVTYAASRSHIGEFVFRTHPNLRGLTDLKFQPLDVSRIAENCELVFTAMPHGASVNLVPKLFEKNLKVIDLGADFRLKNPSDYATWYGWEHPNPELLAEAVYGLPELHRDEIKDARLIACPGCNSTATILGLAPIVKAGITKNDPIVVDAKVGSSGAGSKPSPASNYSERFGGVRPYKITGHRHVAEIEQELNALVAKPLRIAFSAHSVNMVRGISSTIHVFLNQEVSEGEIWKIFRSQYSNEPFIRLVKDRKGLYRLPDPKIVIGSNFCDIGFELETRIGRLVIISAIDNMVKGASGQAVQCLNLLLGIDERTGLRSTALHP
jgi:N-acetyl-gamma-glutamyl-phosphate/LysW-gamma-L-alpha-aminoadipyl-6-phosphate reductase